MLRWNLGNQELRKAGIQESRKAGNQNIFPTTRKPGDWEGKDTTKPRSTFYGAPTFCVSQHPNRRVESARQRIATNDEPTAFQRRGHNQRSCGAFAVAQQRNDEQ